MSGAYWPWWAGALALGAIATAHARLTGRPLGVSGVMARVGRARSELAAEKRETETPAALPETSAPVAAPPNPFAGSVAFLVMMVVGAFLASVVRGGFHPRLTLGAAHEHLFGTGVRSLLVLVGGGLLVGFGTRLSGGCTSGHGLSGCARLVPSSLIATATFLGAAVGTSLLLAGGTR